MPVLAALLLSLFLGIPLLASPRVGFETAVSPSAVTSAFGNQASLRAGFHENDGYVIWESRRDFRVVVFGSRIQPDGVLLDPEGIQISDDAADFNGVGGVFWNGGAWLVIWKNRSSILSRRIDRNGAFLGEVKTLYTAEGPHHLIITRIVEPVTNGKTILLMMDLEPLILLVDADSSEAKRILLPSYLTLLHAATDGTDYLLIGLGHLGRRALVTITGSGEVSEHRPPPAFDFVKFFSYPVWTGSEYVVPVQLKDDSAVLLRFGRDLNIAGPPINLPHFGSLITVEGRLALTWWQSSENIHSLYLSYLDDQYRASPVTQALTQDQMSPPGRIMKTGTGFLMLGDNALALALSADLTRVVAAIPSEQTRGRPAQWDLQPVRNGSSDLVAFLEQDGSGFTKLMVGPIGSPAREIRRGFHTVGWPSIASDGQSALLAWYEANRATGLSDVMALLLTREGEVRGEAVAIAKNVFLYQSEAYRPWDSVSRMFSRPVVAWSGSYYLVAWDDRLSIRTARINASGVLVDREPRPVVASTRQGQFHPVLARLADVMLIVWTEGTGTGSCAITCSDMPSHVRAARLRNDGEVIDAQGIDIATQPYSAGVDVAVNGEVALIVWRNYASSSGRRGVLARRFTARGSLPEMTPIEIASEPVFSTGVAAHEDGFLVLVPRQNSADGRWSANVRPVSKSGVLSAETEISHLSESATNPIIWTTATGRAAVGYELISRDTRMIPRLMYRLLDSDLRARIRAVRR